MVQKTHKWLQSGSGLTDARHSEEEEDAHHQGGHLRSDGQDLGRQQALGRLHAAVVRPRPNGQQVAHKRVKVDTVEAASAQTHAEAGSSGRHEGVHAG